VTYQSSHGLFAMPIPLHAQTDAAREAVRSMQRMAHERQVQRMVGGWTDGRGEHRGGIVTKHGNPPASVWEGDPVSRNARALLTLAEENGFTAHLLVAGDHCIVEGYRLEPDKLGFRAGWLRGSADVFVWCTPWRYEIISDERPIGIDQKARTGKVGYRGAGMGTTRLSIVGSPWGVKVTYVELQRRVRAASVVGS